jgi:hypothetical protein
MAVIPVDQISAQPLYPFSNMTYDAREVSSKQNTNTLHANLWSHPEWGPYFGCPFISTIFQSASHSKIGQFDTSIGTNKHVSSFDVPMYFELGVHKL